MSLLNRDDFKKSLINTKVNESDDLNKSKKVTELTIELQDILDAKLEDNYADSYELDIDNQEVYFCDGVGAEIPGLRINLSDILDKVNESTEDSLEDIIEIKEYFETYGYSLTDKFNLVEFSENVDLPIKTCVVLLCNMETGEVMTDIANGDYDTFDAWDETQFNDSYYDFMEQLGLETDLDESASKIEDLKVGDTVLVADVQGKDREGIIASINGDMAQVDFSGGDVYGIVLSRILSKVEKPTEVNEALEKNTIPVFNGLSAYQKPKEFIEPNKIMTKISDILAAGKKLIITADIWNQPGVPAHKQESEFNVEAINGNILKVISAKYGKEYEIKNPKNIEEIYVVDSIEEKLEVLDENEESTEAEFKIEDYPELQKELIQYNIIVTNFRLTKTTKPKLSVTLDQYEELYISEITGLIKLGLIKIAAGDKKEATLRLIFDISKLS